MTIEIGLLIALISTAGALTFGIIAVARNKKVDTKSEATCITQMATKLTAIEKTVDEIRTDIKGMARENAEMGQKLATIEENGRGLQQRVLRLETGRGAN